MHLFISARQSLTAMDAVLARVARAWKLSQQGLWAFMLMVEASEPVGASWLGVPSGRARQQLHRALQRLEARGLVEGLGHGTNARRWSLTPQGHQRGQRLRAVFDEWVSMLGRRVDVPRLEADLMRVVAVLVNRPQDRPHRPHRSLEAAVTSLRHTGPTQTPTHPRHPRTARPQAWRSARHPGSSAARTPTAASRSPRWAPAA